MAANVTYIPPKAAKPEALRVAAYCRVSSDSSDQLHSYATQIKAYTEQIGAHADEGLTGTRMDKREDFQRLLADCRKGKVDRVLCKSISRFARNTKDCLAALRELSALGVTVYFEKENIDTGTLTSELMVSVSGALAQQESISISQNQRMSYKRRMERGELPAKPPSATAWWRGKNWRSSRKKPSGYDGYSHPIFQEKVWSGLRNRWKRLEFQLRTMLHTGRKHPFSIS